MKENLTEVISCIVAVMSFLAVVFFTGLQLSRKIVDAYKIEILRLFRSEPTASIFQWYRKTSNSSMPIFSEMKGFFPAILRIKYCERYFASAIVEIELELGEQIYLKGINYDESLSESRSKIFQFIENHQKEFKAAMRNEDFLNVPCLVDKYFRELCDALEDTADQ